MCSNSMWWTAKAAYCNSNYYLCIWCRNFKEVGIRMQWPHLILPVKNQVVDFIVR